MFQFAKSFTKGYEAYMTKVGRNQARRVLLAQGDRSLEDMGISRHLLLQGVDAWPWRDGEVQPIPSRVLAAQKRREENRAIRELRAMSNAELSDMGISRGGIVAAVRHGRSTDQVAPAAVKQPALKSGATQTVAAPAVAVSEEAAPTNAAA